VPRSGAGYAVSEMVTSRSDLWTASRPRAAPTTTASRADRGADRRHRRAMMAEAARYNIDRGAQIIDINMGCPAKKVCNKWAGSALMQDEPLALRIVEAVVRACAPRGVPVTLKMRTGWCAANATRGAGARASRTRACDAHRARPHARAGLQGGASTTRSPR
jgi:tRNA-dihydrouridine synthase B